MRKKMRVGKTSVAILRRKKGNRSTWPASSRSRRQSTKECQKRGGIQTNGSVGSWASLALSGRKSSGGRRFTTGNLPSFLGGIFSKKSSETILCLSPQIL